MRRPNGTFREHLREHYESQGLLVRVSWQATVIILSMIIIPIAIFTPDGDHGVRVVVWSIVAAALLLCAFAVWSRLSKVRYKEERIAIWKRLGSGIIILIAAAVLHFISYNYGTFSGTFSSDKLYLLPEGLYVVGLVLVCKAMISEE